MRALAQVAEKFGWAIGGFAAAYTVSGSMGIALFGLTMLLSASIQSTLLRVLKTNIGPKQLRQSLILRMISFGLLAVATWLNNFSLLLLGSALSGLFVGLFWPSFYKLKNGGIEGWYLQEKAIGLMLTISSGLIIVGWNVVPVFIASMIAATGSLLMTYRIEIPSIHQQSKFFTNTSDQYIPTTQTAAALSFLEGSLFAIVLMTRRLVVLTGTIVIPGLSGILSETLFIAVAGLLGASITHYSKDRVREHIRLYWGLSICTIGILLACTGITKYWIIGILILGIGSTIIFPLNHSYVKGLLESQEISIDGFRESWRNPGRLLGALVATWIWFTYESHSAPFFFALALIVGYGAFAYQSVNQISSGTLINSKCVTERHI